MTLQQTQFFTLFSEFNHSDIETPDEFADSEPNPYNPTLMQPQFSPQ